MAAQSRSDRARKPTLEGLERRNAAAVLMVPAPHLAEDLPRFPSGLYPPQQPIRPAVMPDPDAPAGPLPTSTGKPTSKPTPPPPPAPRPAPSVYGFWFRYGLLSGALAGHGEIPVIVQPLTDR